jgi:hypothetical protein
LDKCRLSWTRHCPDYVIKEWNEQTFSTYRIPFFDEALQRRQFAFASDYARALVLHEFGGIYLDTDVELRKPLDQFLSHRAFTGFEAVGLPFTAVWGSEKGHSLSALIRKHYVGAAFSVTTNTIIVSNVISDCYGIDRNRDTLQHGEDGLVVYPSSTLCVDLEESVAVHHFAGSWLTQKSGRMPYKTAVAIRYHANKIAELNGFTNKAIFKIIREKVGIFPFLAWFLRRSATHYAKGYRTDRKVTSSK